MVFKQHFNMRCLGALGTAELLLVYSASQAQSLKGSSGEMVRQSTAKPGVKHFGFCSYSIPTAVCAL